MGSLSPATYGLNRVFKHLSFSQASGVTARLFHFLQRLFVWGGIAGVRFYKVKVLIFGVKSGELSLMRGQVNLRIATIEANT